MVIASSKNDVHWNYFLAVERDLEVLSRYVEFHSENMGCFSLEIARIILAAGAETDVVCKQLCRNYHPSSRAGNINEYRDELKAAIPGLPDFEVLISRYGLSLHPWDEWHSSTGVPHWWTAYNKTKHNRDSEYQKANLQNALNAVAGLFTVVLYLYKDKAEAGELLPDTSLFEAGRDHFDKIVIVGKPVYKL